MARPREQQVKFHIEAGDYFSTLATVLGLVQDAFSGMSHVKDSHTLSLQALNNLKNELLFLQKHYKIVEKPSDRQLITSD